MGLVHDFLLVPDNDDGEFNVVSFVGQFRDAVRLGSEDYVGIHGDLVDYFWDFIKWIPTYNPSKKEPGLGLNYYGVTVIKKDGAQLAYEVFSLLARLVALGPETITLRGNYVFNNNGTKGGYEEVEFNRDETVRKLEKLAFFCRRILNSDYQLKHLGI
ncbi:MAG: hypothetical protein ACM3MK_03695 [Chitinophagales bacterium]